MGPKPTAEGSREVTVVPVASEQPLRNYAWIEDNRRYVDKVTRRPRRVRLHARHRPSAGYTNFNRYFYAQVGKDAVIVDERFNGGGNLATDIVEQLSAAADEHGGHARRRERGAAAGRDLRARRSCSINELAGSGGDAMPWYFRKAGVGPLIGKRTWGGLVGRAAGVPLMDGGFVGAPSSAVWDPATSEWIAENVGVAPDIEVEQDPALVRQGKDPQLDKAIEVVMAELKKRPATTVKRPAYPVYKR